MLRPQIHHHRLHLTLSPTPLPTPKRNFHIRPLKPPARIRAQELKSKPDQSGWSAVEVTVLGPREVGNEAEVSEVAVGDFDAGVQLGEVVGFDVAVVVDYALVDDVEGVEGGVAFVGSWLGGHGGW